ncbi:hypothetical protein AB0L85_15980 [Streptomyces sp. NPDC052051]|uniref:hypothetical protein n=1 Tax=Streptomyces sp. NPDC052051 TaxID=3154649 RepID=UPI003412138E
MTAGWCMRAIRAAVFAAVCVLLAALGHVLMSGSDVPAWALTAGLAGTAAAGWCLAGRERGRTMIVTVVFAAQAVLHEAFSYAQSASGGSASMTMSGMGHMGLGHTGAGHMGADHMSMSHMSMNHMGMGSMGSMGGMGMGSMNHLPQTGLGHLGDLLSGVGSSPFGMLAAHLLAALLCGLWLAYGERAAFRILRAVAGWLVAPLRLLLALPATPDRPRVHLRRCRSDRAPPLLLLAHAITSRGPPVGTAVV